MIHGRRRRGGKGLIGLLGIPEVGAEVVGPPTQLDGDNLVHCVVQRPLGLLRENDQLLAARTRKLRTLRLERSA